ncbi:MAG: GTPase HflX [Desulfobulbaceae bacterium]|jgi:GTP-binding protein HflX|nr:GTPase HflX [Desulfobulbaceae bacterium]
MGVVHGNIEGLKKQQVKALERLAGKRASRDQVLSPEMARAMSAISAEINRQVGLLVARSGDIAMVLVGDHHGIMIPQLTGRGGNAGGRLRGLRFVHTHLAGEKISEEDLMDLLFLRLDLLSVVQVDGSGLPARLESAHLLPRAVDGKNWRLLEPIHPANQTGSLTELIEDLERQFADAAGSRAIAVNDDRAILVSISAEARALAEESLAELAELARSAAVTVVGRVAQRRAQINSRLLLGKGKLAEIMILALTTGANLLIFNQELGTSQMRSITDFTDLRVIDRTQLILDIFASRALSREGKLQVEMAQLKYLLPRLTTRDDSLSRLTGGIGARGPGETKLEIDKRRINDRLARLKKELDAVTAERFRRRSRRRKKDLPVLSLVGYTNAGKSTLLNTLTNSDIIAEDKLFATLDPTSRRLRFPTEMEVILTDTVGFIRDLPPALVQAFMATLEELREADLLLHVIDAANPSFRRHMTVVEELLRQLELDGIAVLKVYNKIDAVENREEIMRLAEEDGAIAISAREPESLRPLLIEAEKIIGKTLGDARIGEAGVSDDTTASETSEFSRWNA